MVLNSNKIVSLLITIVSLIFVSFHLYTGFFGSMEVIMQRALHLLLGLVLLYLISLKKSQKKSEKIINVLAVIGAVVSISYIFLRYDWIVAQRFPYVTSLTIPEIIMGLALVILVIEAVRRLIGNIMVFVVLAFLIYPFIGPYLPGVLQTRQIAWTDILDLLYLTSGGIMGITLGVSATVLALFIIFGAFISSTGAGNLLFELSAAAVGKSKGGPAKIAVLASALMGSINGAPAANVVTTGALTIPMMKRLGYNSNFAGAVEACASTGGQFLPPVMGAVAFLMAAFIGVPYVEIMKYALIPALIFYFSVYITVHLEAVKLNLAPVAATKTVKEVLKEYGHMLFPIFILMVMLVAGFSPPMSGTIAILLLVVTSFLKASTRPTFSELIKAFEEGAAGALVVISATAAAGIVVGIINYTGIGERLAAYLVSMGHGNLFLVLVLVAVISLILGMGMPPVPSYVLQVGLTIPALIDIGVPVYIAHLFVFYFCGLSLITPPIAVASYAAAGLSGGSPMKTGFEAFRIAIPSFIVPFMFVLNPALLFNGPIFSVILVTVTALLGVLALAASMEGYLIRKMNLVERLLGILAAILLILPLKSTIIPGIVLLVILFLNQKRASGKGASIVS